MRQLLAFFPNSFVENYAIHCHGNGKIKANIKAYNKAAQFGCWFVITDLDKGKYACAPSLINDWLPVPQNPQFLFRVAVHEIESWLLADRDNFASFFKVSRDLVPVSPDEVDDPKQTIFSLAKRSQKRNIREGVPPIDNMANIGPGYNIELGDFILNYWNIKTAREHSKSLDKAILALQRLLQENTMGENYA
jgi:hypothetical protein